MNEKECIMLQVLTEEISLTRAAERLYITQPALTYRIQQLEKEFQVPLIEKTTKGTRLTPEGKYLAAYAKRTRNELAKVKDYMCGMRDEVKGTLRLGVSSYFGLYKLPPLLKKFKNQYPDVQINVTSALSAEILDLLQEENIHVGVIRGEYPWFESKILLHDEAIYLISQEKIELSELPELPHFLYQEPRIKSLSQTHSPFSDMVQAWWYERYTSPPTIAMRVDTYETCKEMVKQGMGYAIVPGVFVSEEDKLKRIALIRNNGEPITRNTWMLHKESARGLAIVDRFVHFMSTEHM